LCHGDGGLRRVTALAHSGGIPGSRDNARAISAGLEHPGGLITAAAAIMAAVFVSFALADLVVTKAIGIGASVPGSRQRPARPSRTP